MGKGQIIANLGDGEYTVKVLYNRTRLNNMIAKLTDLIAAAENMMADYNSQLLNQESDLTDINAALQILAGELSGLEGQLSILQGELRNLQDVLKGYQNEIAALETQIADAENSIANLNGQIDGAEAEIDELEIQAAALQAEIDALPDGPEKDAKQAELDAVNLQIADLEADIIAYQGAIGTLNNQIDLWEIEITGIENNDIAPQEVEITAKEKEVSDKQTEVDEKEAEIETKQGVKREKQNDITQTQALIDGKELYITSLEKRKEFLQTVPEDPIVGAWCADLTDDLTGDVATIEPYGEFDFDRTLIRPGYVDRHIWDADRDGQLQFVKAMTPAQTFYNLAMLPGWQTWMPTYRIGTITAINHEANTCAVTVETVRSSQQQLVISGWPTLVDVPIEYMSCNSGAFEVGDRVVIEYRNRSASEDETPYVIGFESEPQPCNFIFTLTLDLTGPLLPEHDPYFSVYDSTGAFVSDIDYEYDATTGKWIVFPVNGEKFNDPNGYWVTFDCDNGVESQYPYKYKESEQRQEADLIKPGEYTDAIPYFSVTDITTYPEYDVITIPDPAWYTEQFRACNVIHLYDYWMDFWAAAFGDIEGSFSTWAKYQVSGVYRYFTKEKTISKRITVKSSIQYELREEIGGVALSGVLPGSITEWTACGDDVCVRGGGHLCAEVRYLSSVDYTGTNLNGTRAHPVPTGTVSSRVVMSNPSGSIDHELSYDMNSFDSGSGDSSCVGWGMDDDGTNKWFPLAAASYGPFNGVYWSAQTFHNLNRIILTAYPYTD